MNDTRTSKSRLVPLCVAPLLLACGCNGSDGPGFGEGGEDGAGNGSTGSGPVTQCTEVVDSVAIIDAQATVPFIRRVEGGYVVALVAGGETWIVTLDDDGMATSRHQLSNSGGQARTPSVHPMSGGMTALWAQGNEVWMRGLDGSGAPAGGAALVAATAAVEPRPAGASTGNAVAATWMDGAASVAGILSGGTLQQQTAVPGFFPAIAAAGGDVAVAWSSGGEQGPVRVASLGAMGSPAEVAGSSSLIKTLTPGPDGFFVAWEDVSGGVEQIGLATIAPSAGMLAQTSPSPSGASANWPALAWSGNRLAVAYYQFRDQAPSVFVTFTDANLAPVGNEVELALNAKYPSVAWGDGEVAVAYSAEGGPVEVSMVRCP